MELLWLSDRSAAATTFAKNYLLAQSGTGNDINGNAKPFTQSGLQTAYTGADAANYFGAAAGARPGRRRAVRCRRSPSTGARLRTTATYRS
ncbi:MAG TPA: hypothetical protein VJ870_20560 [Amycolatopsis sp.]|nr:hypothetical protein [Amycolatopsis sp.]